MSEPVIRASGLVKRYGEAVAVDGIDLDVGHGEIVGLLGPNGSGKTTTILMLLGLTEATAGEARVLGFDPVREPLEVKRRVGYLPDSVGFYDGLTARANLRYTGRLAGIPAAELERRIDAALDRVGLHAAADRRVKTYSRGMIQRLGLAEIVIKQARIAILDEPTAALDPNSTQEFLDMIRGLKADGTSVLLSSHQLDQVQTVCDRVALFQRGRIALQGSVAELAKQVLGGGYGLEVEARGPGVEAALARVPGIVNVTPRGDDRYHVDADRDIRASAARTLVAHGCEVLRLGLAQPSLTEIYTRYFQGVRDAA